MKKILLFVLVAACSSVFAQIDVPAPSPLSTIEQKVGLSNLAIEYSRPSVKGRKIFGDLVPMGEMWRWGANASTKFRTSDDITIEGHDVPAGEYALYAIPGESEWTIIIHKNTSYWGTGGDKYSTDEDLVRFQVKQNSKYPVATETMTFQFSDITSSGCAIEFLWENTQLKIKVETNVDKLVMKEIETKMKGVSSATYFQAARYYYDNDKDINKAYEWVKLSLVDNEKFWMVRLQALIEAKMGDYKSAIATAKKSLELAKQANNQDYVRMNEKSIEEWSKMK